MARRAVIGQQNDGSYGLRVSAAGVDAFLGDGQGGDFTFNSDWADIVRVYQIGLLSWDANAPGFDASGTPNTANGFAAVWTDLGYKPFVEARRRTGSLVYDDYWSSSRLAGAAAQIYRTGFRALEPSTSDQVVYVVYPLQPPVQS